MALNSFPSSLQPAIQTGYLAHMFEEALQSKLAYRNFATVETFTNRVGETITKTRPNLKAPRLTPILGSANTNLDNGLTPSAYAVEQYTLTLNQYGDTIDLNLVTEKVGIANQFARNAKVNGIQASQTLDRLARNTLFSAANSGNTYVNTTSTTTSVKVNDITGFQYAYVNGVLTAVSSGNPLTITMGPNNNTYSVIGAVADGTNVSTAFQGVSGTLTLSTAAATGDAVYASGVGTTVTASTATSVLRPNNRGNTTNLVSGDNFTMSVLLNAVAQLRNNGVTELENGTYGLLLDPTSERQLFSDPDFKLLYSTRGTEDSVYKNAVINDLLGVTFIRTTEAPTYTLNNNTVHCPLLVGDSALIEARMDNMDDIDGVKDQDEVMMFDGAVMVTRPPIDRFRQIVAQSWYSIAAWCVPTDVQTNSTIIPTASNAAVKRVVQIQHV